MKSRLRISQTVRRAINAIFIVLAFSFVLIIIGYLIAYYAFDNDRLLNFLDSITAGLVVFLLIGIITFIFSVRKPEEDQIDRRIDYLYSAPLNDLGQAKGYLREQVHLLGTIVESAKGIFNIVEISDDKKAVKVSTAVSMIMKNLMAHDSYIQDIPLRVWMVPPRNFRECIGQVLFVRTCIAAPDGDSYYEPIEHLEKPYLLLNEQPTFQRNVRLEIPPAGKLKYEYRYETWEDFEPLFSSANRFVGEYELIYRNLLGVPIELRPYEGETNIRTIEYSEVLEPEEEKVYTVSALRPETAFSVAIRAIN